MKVKQTLLTEPQAKLLCQHVLTGGGSGQWKTWRALERKGMVDLGGRDIVVTTRGKDFVDENHLNY